MQHATAWATNPASGTAYVDVFNVDDSINIQDTIQLVLEALHPAQAEVGVIARGLPVRETKLRQNQSWGAENPERYTAPWWQTGWASPLSEEPSV